MQPNRSTLSKTFGIAAATAIAYVTAKSLIRRSRTMDFYGKSVLITGGSRGLGIVLARQFAEEGARVAICLRNKEQLASAEADIRRRGGEVLTVQCDLTVPAQVKEMVEQVSRRFGGIDVLVNNAGTIEVGPLEEMTLADFEIAMKTHFWAPLHTTLAVLPEMRSRAAGESSTFPPSAGRSPSRISCPTAPANLPW